MIDNPAATSSTPPGPIRRVVLVVLMGFAVFAFGMTVGKRMDDRAEAAAAAEAPPR